MDRQNVGPWSGSKPFDTGIVFLKGFIEKLILKKDSRRQQKHKNYPACKGLKIDLNFV